MFPRPSVNPWFYILLTGLMFGMGGLVTEWVLDQETDPFALTAVAFSATAITAFTFTRGVPRLPASGWRVGMALGMLNAAGPAILFNLGFANLPASINTLLISLGPVFTAITAHYWSVADRFTRTKVVGLVVSLAGVAVLAGAPSDEAQGQVWLGVVLSLLGAVMQGVSAVWVKRLAERHQPEAAITPMMAGAALLAVTASIVAGHPPVPSAFTSGQWLILILMGSSGVLAFLSVLKANRMVAASKAALTGYLVPMVGVVGGVAILGEPASALLLVGGLLVIAGVVLVGRSHKEPVVTAQLPDSAADLRRPTR